MNNPLSKVSKDNSTTEVKQRWVLDLNFSTNVWVAKNLTKRSSNTLLRLGRFFATQTLSQLDLVPLLPQARQHILCWKSSQAMEVTTQGQTTVAQVTEK